jgi:hypothetical protein
VSAMTGASGAVMESTSQGNVEGVTSLGMLMESAHVQQQLADAALSRLEAHTKGLDAVVRDEVRQSFTVECAALDEEIHKATVALRSLQRSTDRRIASWTVSILALVGGAAISIIEYAIPSVKDIENLRAERAALSVQISHLADAGGRLELRRCGEQARLCVKVDRNAPSYGDAADYLVVKGY